MVKKKSGHNVAQKLSKNSTKVFKQRDNKDLGKKKGPSSSSSSSSSAPKRSSGPAGRGGRGGRGGGSSNRGGRFGGRGGQAGAAPPPAKRGRYDNSNNNNSKKKVGDGSNGEEMALDPKSKVLADAKALMESAFKTQEPEKRIEYVSKVYGLVKGRMLEVALKHDASRVIQMLLKFGNAHYRNLVIEELEPHVLELAKSKYAHHIVNKMMKYGNKEKVIGRLLGHCFELLKHQFGASVVEEAFSERANGRQRCAMVEEFYGAEFAAFKPEKKRTLSEVLTAAPAKRGPVLRRLKDELSALLNKPHVPDSTLFHHVAAAYFSVCDAADALEMETLLRDSLARMVHTREGVCVALRCVEVATAKDRKAMIKGLKGHVTDACRDSQAHLYVMALLDRTDDTTLLRAALLEPMAEDLRDLATHTYGHLPLLHLLAPRSSRYFHPVAIRDMTFPTEGTPASTSKKPAQQRRAELLDYLLPHLVALAKESAADLLSSLYGSRVLAETLWAQAISPADTQAIAAAIAAAYAQTPTNNNNNDGGGDDDVSVVAGKKAKKGKKRRHQEDLAEDYQDHLNDSSEEEGDGNDGNDGNGDNNNSGGGNGNGGDDESTTTTTTVTVTAPGVSPVGNRWIQKALKDEDPAHAEKVAALWKALFVALRDVLGAWAKHKRLSFIVATLVATAPKYSGDNKKAFKECVAAQIPLKSLVGTQLPGQKLLIEAIKAL